MNHVQLDLLILNVMNKKISTYFKGKYHIVHEHVHKQWIYD